MPIPPTGSGPASPQNAPEPESTDPKIHIPDAYQKAGFTKDDYKKYCDLVIKSCTHEMQRVANKAIEELKKHRRKIQSGEE